MLDVHDRASSALRGKHAYRVDGPERALQWQQAARACMRAGRIVNERALRQRVFCSGVEPDVRREAWKFLLGLYPWDSTAAERAALLRAKQRQYGQLKAQWSSILPQQAARCVCGPILLMLGTGGTLMLVECPAGVAVPVLCVNHGAPLHDAARM